MQVVTNKHKDLESDVSFSFDCADVCFLLDTWPSPLRVPNRCLRADVFYFLCTTKEIGDVCTQANLTVRLNGSFKARLVSDEAGFGHLVV